MVFVGKPGTGKTTVLRRLVRRALEQHRRVLVVTPHENEWCDLPDVHPAHPERIATYKGARRYLCRETEDVLQVCRLFRHGFLIFDDCRVYVPDHQVQEIKSMLISCRQDDIDFAAVGHGFTTVPPLFFTYATHFAVFATTDNVGRRKNCVMNFAALEKTVTDVNYKSTLPERRDREGNLLSGKHYYQIVKNE